MKDNSTSILAHRKSELGPWQSNYEYNNYSLTGESRPVQSAVKGWLTSSFTDDVDRIFKSSPGDFARYTVELHEYDASKDGYYLIHYGHSEDITANCGMKFLTPEIIDKCNRGSIKLLIAFVYETFDRNIDITTWAEGFFQLLTQIGIIRANSVVILTSTAVATQYATDYRCRFIYYPWFELRFQIHVKNKTWGSPDRIIPQAGDFSKKNKHFINLNHRPASHRVLMILYLMKLQVDRYGHISWFNPDNKSWKEILLETEKTNLAEFSGEHEFYSFVKIVDPLRSMPLDCLTLDSPNADFWLGASEFYHSAWVDLVSETHCDLHGNTFLTEKTFKPMAYGLPFIFNATKNHLSCVRQLGYVSFPELFDEQYDHMSYSMEKLAAIGKQISMLCRDPEKIKLIKNSTEIQNKLLYNQRLFLNKNHAELIGKLLYDAWHAV